MKRESARVRSLSLSLSLSFQENDVIHMHAKNQISDFFHLIDFSLIRNEQVGGQFLTKETDIACRSANEKDSRFFLRKKSNSDRLFILIVSIDGWTETWSLIIIIVTEQCYQR